MMKLTEKLKHIHKRYTSYQFTKVVEQELAKIGIERIDLHTDQYADMYSRVMVYPLAYNSYRIEFSNSFSEKFGKRKGMNFERWELECMEQVRQAIKIRTLLERLRGNGNRKSIRKNKRGKSVR